MIRVKNPVGRSIESNLAKCGKVSVLAVLLSLFMGNNEKCSISQALKCVEVIDPDVTTLRLSAGQLECFTTAAQLSVK